MVISLLRKYPEIPNQAGFLLIRGGIQKVFLFVALILELIPNDLGGYSPPG